MWSQVKSINFNLNIHSAGMVNKEKLTECGVIISALCYLMGMSSSCWWGIILWPIPLWYAMWYRPLRWHIVLVWYLIATAAHAFGIGYSISQLAHGCFYTRLLLPVCMYVYYGVLTMIWIAGTSHLLKQGPRTLGCFLSVWVCTTWLYILWVTDYSLLICGVWGGYALFSPLIPLISCPALLWFLPIVGSHVCLFGILMVQSLCVGALLRMRGSVWMVGLVVMIWLWGAVRYNVKQDINTCAYAAHIGVITSCFRGNDTIRIAHHIMEHVCEMSWQSEVNCIIFTESSVYSSDFFFSEQGATCNGLAYEGTLIVGGFRKNESYVYNTAWFIRRGRIIDYYDKQLLVPFTEYIPRWVRCAWLERHFFCDTHEITASYQRGKRPLWEIIPGLCIVPYICSELFFISQPCDGYDSYPIMALCNNRWAPRLMRWMMARTAAFRAFHWHRDIIYIAHEYSSLFISNGDRYELVCEAHVCT